MRPVTLVSEHAVARGRGFLIVVVLTSACTREELPPDEAALDTYAPPAPVQLTPPSSVVREPGDPPFVQFVMTELRVEIEVAGNAYRPIRLERHDMVGRNRIALVTSNEGATATIAEPDFHILATGATQSDGTIMICWNTLTGETSEYSPTTPDPARGMALHCRTWRDGVLGATERIRSRTVGCWIRRVVALPDGGFRLLYKGDDGWFEAGDKPDHGVYDARFSDRWSTPELLLPLPSVEDP